MLLKEAVNPIEEMVSSLESRGTLSRHRVDEITDYITHEIDRRGLDLGDIPAPNGTDYLAFSRIMKIDDRSRLLKSGSGINQTDFHAIMLRIGLRKDYLNNFLQSSEVRKRPSPQNILSRLVRHEITLVATPTTHILTLADNPHSALVVKMGFNFINVNGEIINDFMHSTELNRLQQQFTFVDKDFITGPMGLTPNLIDPLDILSQLQSGKRAMIASNFPEGQFLFLTNQAKEVIQAISESEIVFPNDCLNGNLHGFAAPTIGQTKNFLQQGFSNQGWSV